MSNSAILMLAAAWGVILVASVCSIWKTLADASEPTPAADQGKEPVQ